MSLQMLGVVHVVDKEKVLCTGFSPQSMKLVQWELYQVVQWGVHGATCRACLEIAGEANLVADDIRRAFG